MSNSSPVFKGSKVSREDPRYPALVRGFNQRWVGEPRGVVVCGDVNQVLEAVQQALDDNLRITVRGGGHCYEDFVSGNWGGVIIDVSPLNAVYQEPNQNVFCVEGGCTLWNVYTQLYKEYGLTIPGGSCYSVGVGGHVAGGGYGLLSRLYGLVVDYLYGVELIHVNASGKAEIVRVTRDSASEDERALLWAHQGGGGGNFGIVTKYWFKDPPVAPTLVSLGSIAWDWDQIDQDSFSELVFRYGTFLKGSSQVDSPLKSLFALLHLTKKEAGSQIVLTMQNAYEDPEPMAEFINAIKLNNVEHGPQRVSVGYHHFVPEAKQGRTMTWLEATQTLDPSGPNQRGKYKSAYMIEPFPPAQIDVMWKYLTDPSYANSQALVQVDSYGCQINTVAPDQTAVPQRSSIMKLQYQTYWTEAKDDDANLNWIRSFYTEMYGSGGPAPDDTVDGCYVNYPDVDLINWRYLYYKENYYKLQQVKGRWDPLNIFNHQQSIDLPQSPPLVKEVT